MMQVDPQVGGRLVRRQIRPQFGSDLVPGDVTTERDVGQQVAYSLTSCPIGRWSAIGSSERQPAHQPNSKVEAGPSRRDFGLGSCPLRQWPTVAFDDAAKPHAKVGLGVEDFGRPRSGAGAERELGQQRRGNVDLQQCSRGPGKFLGKRRVAGPQSHEGRAGLDRHRQGGSEVAVVQRFGTRHQAPNGSQREEVGPFRPGTDRDVVEQRAERGDRGLLVDGHQLDHSRRHLGEQLAETSRGTRAAKIVLGENGHLFVGSGHHTHHHDHAAEPCCRHQGQRAGTLWQKTGEGPRVHWVDLSPHPDRQGLVHVADAARQHLIEGGSDRFGPTKVHQPDPHRLLALLRVEVAKAVQERKRSLQVADALTLP